MILASYSISLMYKSIQITILHFSLRLLEDYPKDIPVKHKKHSKTIIVDRILAN